MKKTIILIVILAGISFGQHSGSTGDEGSIKDLVEETKLQLKDSDIEVRLTEWHTELKANSFKLKMIFDEEGFVLMLKMISLGKKISNPENTLSDTDTGNIISFISAAERLGCEAPPGLREILVKRIGNCSGKTWQESIHILKGN